MNTSTFKNDQIESTANIQDAVTCKSQWIIHLLECVLCHFQHAGKSKTIFNKEETTSSERHELPKSYPSLRSF